MTYPTRIDVCDGKYIIIYDFDTGQSEALRYGESGVTCAATRWC